MTAPPATDSLVDPQMFLDLQKKIEDDSKTRDEIRDIVQSLEKHVKITLSILSNAYRSPEEGVKGESQSAAALTAMRLDVATLSGVVDANQLPFYKFNSWWTRHMQDASFAVLFSNFLDLIDKDGEQRLLMTLEEVGEALKVPVNLKDRDAFHLTIEEYLHSLVSLIDELARLARNSVTLGNYRRPVIISQFIKDVYAGFQLLNLKNDTLRRRTDSIKYKIREVEDVVYDLSLRNLIPRST